MKSRKLITSGLLLISFGTFSVSAQAQSLDQKYCYSLAEVEQLAEGLVTLQKCEAVLVEKERLIQERLTEFKGPQEGRLWWQDPAWVGGGLVASFSLGILLMYTVR